MVAQEQHNQKAFALVQPKQFNGFEESVASICQSVTPQTCGQSSADWFIERMFALTSSQIAGIVRRLTWVRVRGKCLTDQRGLVECRLQIGGKQEPLLKRLDRGNSARP